MEEKQTNRYDRLNLIHSENNSATKWCYTDSEVMGELANFLFPLHVFSQFFILHPLNTLHSLAIRL